MKTQLRLKLLAQTTRHLPELGSPTFMELAQWLKAELGSLYALENKQKSGRHHILAVAPRHLYLIGANNLEVSSFQVILAALVLGSSITVKLPSQRSREIKAFIKKFPASLRRLIRTETILDKKKLHSADAVVVLGQDQTIAEIRALVSAQCRFVGYGHKFSLIHLTRFPSPAEIKAIALDISLYDQNGCLSPQTIYYAPSVSVNQLGPALGEALTFWAKRLKFLPRTLYGHAQVQEARDWARARGLTLWCSANSTVWTVIADSDPTLVLSPGYRVIFLKPLPPVFSASTRTLLQNHLSTVGYVGSPTILTKKWAAFGASRFCPAGTMQYPPLTWHHDGRSLLADLVTWIDWES
jgi:hypothetical protein